VFLRSNAVKLLRRLRPGNGVEARADGRSQQRIRLLTLRAERRDPERHREVDAEPSAMAIRYPGRRAWCRHEGETRFSGDKDLKSMRGVSRCATRLDLGVSRELDPSSDGAAMARKTVTGESLFRAFGIWRGPGTSC
jgi:hypothetical protein